MPPSQTFNAAARQTRRWISCPKFQFVFLVICAVSVLVWLNPDSLVSWQAIEENLASPRRLQDLVYSNLPPKYSRSKLGPISSFLLSTCQSVENATHTQLIWRTHTPIFHNVSPLTGGVPFSSPQWSDKGIHTLSDICNEKGLRTFNDLQISSNLPGFSFFLYLELRSSMGAYGVPWGQRLYLHDLHILLNVGVNTGGLVSRLYTLLLKSSCGPLAIHQVWERDIDHLGDEVDWTTVWDNLDCTSKNPNHKLIHFNFLHRQKKTNHNRLSDECFQRLLLMRFNRYFSQVGSVEEEKNA